MAWKVAAHAHCKFCKLILFSNGKSGAEWNCFLGFAVRAVTTLALLMGLGCKWQTFVQWKVLQFSIHCLKVPLWAVIHHVRDGDPLNEQLWCSFHVNSSYFPWCDFCFAVGDFSALVWLVRLAFLTAYQQWGLGGYFYCPLDRLAACVNLCGQWDCFWEALPASRNRGSPCTGL